MIEFIGSISKRFQWSKPFVLLAGLLFFTLFIVTILDIPYFQSGEYLIPSLVGTLWSALFFVLVSAFPYVPTAPQKNDTFLFKMKRRIQRGLFYMLGVIFIVSTIGVIFLSFKLFGIWQDEF